MQLINDILAMLLFITLIIVAIQERTESLQLDESSHKISNSCA
jgi:hypothetical protein